MNNLFKSYTSFSRTERVGILALLLLIGVLILARATMHLWVQPEEVELSQVTIPANKGKKKVQNLNTQYYQQAIGEKINLNTADSLMLVSLPGIGKGLSHRILERRCKLGKFTNMEQVFEVYMFKEETKQMLLNRTKIE